MSCRRCLAGVLSAAAVLESASADVLFVDDDAGPGGDGLSWATAYRSLQDALSFAGDPDHGIDEIRVAQGAYVPYEPEPLSDCCRAHDSPGCEVSKCQDAVCATWPPCCASMWDEVCAAVAAVVSCVELCADVLDPTATFHLIDGVALRGGYTGLSGADPDERDVQAYQTILSGDFLGDDEPGSLPGATAADNAWHVVTGSGTGPTAILEGFVVTGGYGAGGSGGALLNEGGSPAVLECTFRLNRATSGGAVGNVNSAARFARCNFQQNDADQGGAVYNEAGAPEFSQCVFDCGVRSVIAGGAMYNLDSDPLVDACSFTAEYADPWQLSAGSGGAMYSRGGSPVVTGCSFVGLRANYGGAVVNHEESSPTLSGCLFEGNTAGGAPYVRGGAIFNFLSFPVIAECTFTENATLPQGHPHDTNGIGGAVSSLGGGPVIMDCSFTGNSADGGGALSTWGASTIIDCSFVDNIALLNNGGAVAHGNEPYVLIGCDFTGNVARRGGALYDVDTDGSLVSHCRFVGNSAEYDAGAMLCWYPGARHIEGSLFNGNTTTGDGGGLAVWSDSLELGATVTMSNTTMTANSAGGLGGAVFVGQPHPGGGLFSGATLRNCILWGNEDGTGTGEDAQMFVGFWHLAEVQYSCVQGLDQFGKSPGNIGSDPLFVDPDGENGFPGDGDDDLSLAPGSPCIDAGWNNAVQPDSADLDGDGDNVELTPFDLLGSARFADDPASDDTGCGVPVIVDIGAYEFQGDPVTAVFGDLNGNGAANVPDLVILSGCIGSDAPECCTADLDLDGEVTPIDLGLLIDRLLVVAPYGPLTRGGRAGH